MAVQVGHRSFRSGGSAAKETSQLTQQSTAHCQAVSLQQVCLSRCHMMYDTAVHGTAHSYRSTHRRHSYADLLLWWQ